MRRRVWGLSGRLIASYILVTLAVVVLVEALVLGFQVPSLVNGAQLQAQVDAAAKSYARQLSQRYPGGHRGGGDRRRRHGRRVLPPISVPAPTGRGHQNTEHR